MAHAGSPCPALHLKLSPSEVAFVGKAWLLESSLRLYGYGVSP